MRPTNVAITLNDHLTSPQILSAISIEVRLIGPLKSTTGDRSIARLTADGQHPDQSSNCGHNSAENYGSFYRILEYRFRCCGGSEKSRSGWQV
jgi:hypothetical protein